MKVVILAGGRGSRLAAQGNARPKALVEIGGRPILWHVMKLYAHHGFTDFILALGYKGVAIRAYFAGRRARSSGRRASVRSGNRPELEADWRVALVDTGTDTHTGGRLRRLRDRLDGTFMCTWCDGLGDIDLRRLLAFHRAHGRLATVTAVRPPARFGRLVLRGDRVVEFHEKRLREDDWVNGAFFVLEPGALSYIAGDDTDFEREPLETLARDGELMAFRHHSFWQCMDTPVERRLLAAQWATGSAAWKVWR